MLRRIWRIARLVAPFLLAVGGACWAALGLFSALNARWTERDALLRARLAVSATHDQVVAQLEAGDVAALQRLLDRVVRDERIGGLAICRSDGSLLVQTECFPGTLRCSDLVPLFAPGGGDWSYRVALPLPARSAHVTGIPVADDSETLAFAVVEQGLAFAERRERQVDLGLELFFALLALVGSVAIVAGYRFSWRTWSIDLRQLLKSDAIQRRPEFQPLLRDVRDLVSRLASESAEGFGRGGFTADRLRQTLRRQLHGDRVIAVSHRAPFLHERSPDGNVVVRHPASGLVTALDPVMRACSGVWIAHGSGSADAETVDERGKVPAPDGAYTLRRLRLSEAEQKGFYFGFSNEGLWPLCHLAHTRPVFRAWDWEQYRRVNQRFAQAVCEEADVSDPIVLLQDYQFALAARMIRDRLPNATLLTFWHIPWPSAERIAICPWYEEILEGLLGSTILGFQTQLYCNNFVETVDRFLEARIDRERQAISLRGESTLIRPYPISIDWPPRALQAAPPIAECRAAVRAELGLDPAIRIGLSVDRMDYTKGIEDRMLAVERLLETRPDLRQTFTLVQLAPPSRTAIGRYRELERDAAAIAERINGRFSRGRWQPILLRRNHHEPEEVYRYYRAADFCHVGSLSDGMNLVAKEFVAARDDRRGVLILSSFTGAARELTEALIVNPYDVGESAHAMAAALEMSDEEQEARMTAMRTFLGEFNVYRWAERMLVDGARARRSVRLRERLRQAAGSES